jgi:hypothetical protein
MRTGRWKQVAIFELTAFSTCVILCKELKEERESVWIRRYYEIMKQSKKLYIKAPLQKKKTPLKQ